MRKTVDEWAKIKGTLAMVLAGAKHHHRWPLGQELTEAEYDKAIAAYLKEPIR